MTTLWVPLVLLLIATGCDLYNRTIPDWISVAMLGWAVVATAFGWHDVTWLSGLAGLAIGFGLTAVLFALGGLGGGDVKLTTALGAALGYLTLLKVLFWVALAGGVLAVVAHLRRQRELAYVPAIALGFVMFLVWRGGLADVFGSTFAR